MGGGDGNDGVVLGVFPLLPREGVIVLGEASGDIAGEDMLL